MFNRVTQILRDTAETVVMPSFRALRPEDIAMKETAGDPDDIVTVTDKAAEHHLVKELTGIVADAAFIGEEAVCENPALVEALSRPAPVWLIDPIDGTKNFARGNANFGIMLALVEGGATRASWMAMPATGDIISAELGNGTLLNGVQLETAPLMSITPRGTVHNRLMPPETAISVHERLFNRYTPQPSTGSAATEYGAILHGEKEFVIYYRLLPWDHAPGALALTEAGGAAVHLDGRPYTPLSTDQVTIFAASPQIAATIRTWLYAPGFP